MAPPEEQHIAGTAGYVCDQVLSLFAFFLPIT